MFGFIIGTACLIGLIATLRRGHHWHRGYGYGGGGCGGYGRSACGPGYGPESWDRGYDRDHGPYRGDHGHHDHDHGHRGGFRGFGRGFGFGPRAFVYRLLARLEATPAQERVIVNAIEEFRDVAKSQRAELRESRKDVAKALRADGFDAVLMGETFARHDGRIEEVRKAFVGALSKIHDALDERQRKILADMVEGGFWS